MKTIPGLAMLALLALSTLNSALSTAHAQGTAFTYQGRLNDGAAPANGSYDLRFILYDNSVGGNQQGPILTNSATAVSNGLFIVTLDFGNQFPGTNRYLEIAVRTNGSGAFTTLSPRQSLTPTPYAITAGNVVSGGIPAGTYGNAVTFSNSADSFSGTFTGNGSALLNVNAASLGGLTSSNFWQLGGNSVASGQFLGSLNNQPLELWVNGMRGLRLEPTANTVTDSNIVNVIGGSPANYVIAGVYGATISGGGGQNYGGSIAANSVASDFSVVGGGGANQVQGNAFSSTVGGGFNNVIQQGATYSTIGGGGLNNIAISNQDSVIGGGYTNVMQGGIVASVIAGGQANQIQTNANYCAIGGGYFNGIQAYNRYSTISGGGVNGIQAYDQDATIGGGYNNLIQSNVVNGTISGGGGNTIETNAYDSTISGGDANKIQGNAYESVVAGGGHNVIQTNAYQSTISGGAHNQIWLNANDSTINGGELNSVVPDHSNIGGGYANSIQSSSGDNVIAGGIENAIVDFNNQGSTIGGGEYNTNHASTSSFGYNTIAGGLLNHTDSSGATIGGGRDNSATNSFTTVSGGDYNSSFGFGATVPGGQGNTASGGESFAAGYLAQAANEGTFVWSDDSTGSYFTSTAPYQFLIRAAGGVGIGLNNPTAALHVASGGNYVTPQAQVTQNNTGDACRLRLNVSGHPSWEMDVSSDPTAPQLQFWNNTLRMYVDYSGNVTAASFVTASDRNLKENFSAVSPQEVLDKVAALPITRWNFKEDKASEHLGPMAQDFHAAFGLGADDKHIATVDESGVALAAIQGLNQKLEQKLEQKETEITELKQNVAELKKMLQVIAEKK